jgi:hypothetical protein
MKIYKLEHIDSSQGDYPDITELGYFMKFPTVEDILKTDAEDYATKEEFIKLLENEVGSLIVRRTSYSIETIEISEIEIIEN